MTVGQAAVFAVFVFVTVVVVTDWAVAVSVSVMVEIICTESVNMNSSMIPSTTNLVRLLDRLCLDHSRRESICHFSIIDLRHSIGTGEQDCRSTNER